MKRFGTIALLCLATTGVIAQNLFAQEVLAPGWRVTDIGDGTKPSLDFGPDGSIHVMGMTETFTGVVWHASAADSTGPWEPQEVSNGYFYGPGDLRVDNGGVAHMAWHHHDLQDAFSVSVAPDGSVRSDRAITPNSHDGWDNSLAIESTGTLVQASVFPSGFGASNSLVYSTLTDDDGWVSETVVGSDSFMYGFGTGLALESNDQPHILYTSAGDWTAPGELIHATRADNGEWAFESVVTGGIRGRFPSLAIDAQDQLHAAWLDIDLDDVDQGTVRYGTYQDGEWAVEAIDELNNIDLSFSGGRKLVSLAVDSNGQPHIAYGDQGVVKYATTDAAGWDQELVLEAQGDSMYNGMVILRLNPTTDLPAIAFWEPTTNGDGVVRLLTGERDAGLPGDVNNDGAVDVDDIDAIRGAIASGDSEDRFDVDGNGIVDPADYDVWISDAKRTYLGDANLDGQFDTADLVAAFRPGEYEDDVPLNSSWSTGDWNGDFEFDSTDIVAAFADGGYETGPRAAAVPEPPTGGLLCIALVQLAWLHRISVNRSAY